VLAMEILSWRDDETVIDAAKKAATN